MIRLAIEKNLQKKKEERQSYKNYKKIAAPENL